MTYVPVLRNKKAEMFALAELDPGLRRRAIPLLQIARPQRPERGSRRRWVFENEVGGLIDAKDKSLIQCWGCDQPIRIDLGELWDTPEWTRPEDPVAYFLSRSADLGIICVPTVGRHHPREYRRSAARMAHELENGACIRITGSDLSAGRDGLGPVIADLQLSASLIDIVLDLGQPAAPPEVMADVVRQQMHRLEPLADFRTVTLCCSAMPKFLDLGYGESGQIPRSDEALWRLVSQSQGPDRHLMFGDYGVVDPDPPPPFRGAANLRYTSKSHWLVWRGHRPEDVDGLEYGRLASQLLNSPGWMGARHCAGCAFISAHAGTRKGSSTQWRQAAFSHHFTCVLSRLSETTNG